jgi:phage-related protein (TIGR01555 family)
MDEAKQEQLGLEVRYDDLLQSAMMAQGGQFQGAQLDASRGSVLRLSTQGYNVLSSAYEADGLFAAMIDRPAEDAMAAGFKYAEGASNELKQSFADLEINDVLTDALRFARLHGGSLIVPVFVGQRSFSQPLRPSRMREIEEFMVVSLDRVTVHEYGVDGWPLVYNVQSVLQPQNGTGGEFKLHTTRCIPVYGRQRPWKQVDSELIWPGVSEGARIMPSAMRLSRAFRWSEKALERKSQGIFQMKGLGAALQLNQKDLVTKRLQMVDTVRSLLNTVAIDADDNYTISDTSLSSISDTLDSLMQDNAAVSGVPITVIFGRRTTSLNASGDGDTDTYYRMLGKLRVTLLRNPLNTIIKFLAAYMTVGTSEANEPLVTIAKLDTLSEFEQAEVDLKKAQALKARAEAIKLLSGEPETVSTPTPAAAKPGAKSGATPPATAKPVVTKPATPALITPQEAKQLLNLEDMK